MTMTIQYERVTRASGEVLVIDLAGSIFGDAAGRLLDALVDVARAGKAKVIVDLGRVTFASRAAFCGVVVAGKLLRAAGGELRLCGACGQVSENLVLAGFSGLLRSDTDRTESLELLLEHPEPEVETAQLVDPAPRRRRLGLNYR